MKIIFAIVASVLFAPAIYAAGPLALLGHTTQIAMYGDSTTYGMTGVSLGTVQSPMNEPAQLGRMITAAGYDATVTNHGLPGEVTADLLHGTGSFPRTWAAEMSLSTADIVVVNLGMNDTRAIFVLGTETPEQFRSNWTQIIQIAHAAGKIIFIETPNPAWAPDQKQVLWAAVMEMQVLFASSADTGWIDQYTNIVDHYPDWQAALADGVHPDASLYTQKATIDLLYLAPELHLINP